MNLLEANKAIIGNLLEALDNGNWSRYAEFYAPDYVYKGQGGPLSREEEEQGTRLFISAFPNWKHTIEDQIAENDKVVTRYTGQGTHQGEYEGIPPTGKKITLTGIWITRIVDGKIVESWGEGDMLGFMQKLGALTKS